jgi:hypothetical protein
MTRVLSIVGIVLFAAVALSACRGPGAEGLEDAPEQPIAFFHSVHAGENQIPCAFCHYTADRSQSAGIPAVAVCVGCHVPGSATLPPEQAQLAFPSADRDSLWSEEAQELVEYWQRQEAIPWVRIHELPEHVRFPHMSHVNVGLECQTCHGPVEEMEEIYQFSSLQMGWCVDCHRGALPISEEEEASIRERSSYVREVMAMAEAGSDVRGAEAVWPTQRASTDCMVCHY